MPKREREPYSQVSFLTKTPEQIATKKTFVSLPGTRLAEFINLKNPIGWILKHELIFQLAGKEKSPSQNLGISIHESGYFHLLMAQYPLPPGKDPYLHVQEVAKLYLPDRFPTANTIDSRKREVILTTYLPEIWPKVGENLDKNSLKKLFDIVRQDTLYPHPPNQPHLIKVGPDVELDGIHRLRNLAQFSQENLLPRILKSEYALCEFSIIQFFRGRWKVKVTSMADLLIVSKSIRGDGVPIWTYDLFDIKSGKKLSKKDQKKLYHDNLYQLWIMKRALERATPEQIQKAISKREALRIETADSPLETVQVNGYFIWPGEYWHPEETCELAELPDDKKTGKKLFRVLSLYRKFKDGKLRKGFSSNRELLLGKK